MTKRLFHKLTTLAVVSLFVSDASTVRAQAPTNLLDFSTCGYASQARPIPNAPVRVVVAPQGGDNTARIQAALDYVGTLPVDASGVRGAVLLQKGRHGVLGGLIITHSGVVLRGEGVGQDGTTLVAMGSDRRTLIRALGPKPPVNDGYVSELINGPIPFGANTLTLSQTNGWAVGNSISLTRPSTTNWIALLHAADLGGGEGGGWRAGSRDVTWTRMITAIQGNTITLDAPLTTALEEGGILRLIERETRLNNIGIENLALETTVDASNAKDENHSWFAITMEHTADAWVRQVTFRHFAGSAVALYETCQRVTVQDCVSYAPVSEIGGYRRHTFFTMGQQTLFLRCSAERGRHDFSVGHCAAGPNAFVQCEAREALDDSGPIESWASGVLYDNVTVDGNALSLGFRAGNNASIGWAAANSVLWNCSASVVRCWNPPGAHNWSFGSWGSFEGDGVWKSSNDFVSPPSLFEAQLKQRLGTDATSRLKLMARSHEESSNPPVDKAQELAAASHHPVPQLRDYILAANQREPISIEADGAKNADDIFHPAAPEKPGRHGLVITNGWLTVDGKLVIGSSATVAWWRGNIRPEEAKEFGLGVTRFVPGRIGPGFTDDLETVADRMETDGDAALNHNYGLWYDRRRDDHERIRRINGDVLPPFYEMPFARSGEGLAWLGLSKYDLTKFNPWYWSRLQQFADICDRRGLVLFHQNYFQHNILEAGAHWADSPWRTANNINGTDFPEPPPYAGDKRIFQAELFYDETHPVRRKLHEGYIRQCLENFKSNANVIQFISAEYTGPLHFTEFWLDTIAAWEKANPSAHPFIALSCTKDVQDAILSDPARNATVEVIDFRYWWRTDKGEYSPPGGKNLAPRQFERMWKGGRPNDRNLAGMASEYHAKYPAKPIICDFDAAGWAWVCAGGSMPRLPKTTDPKLLAAIPHMKPWTKRAEASQLALGESHKQFLVYGSKDMDFNLSDETGTFKLYAVDARTGKLSAQPQSVQAGGTVKLPADLVWLTAE